jgi:hypothetical protein
MRLEPSLESLLRRGGEVVAFIGESLASGAIGKLCEPVFSFTRNVCGVFHVSPATELDSGLPFDRLERADREIFARVWDRHHAWRARVLVLLVAAFGMSEIPAVSEQDLDDLRDVTVSSYN